MLSSWLGTDRFAGKSQRRLIASCHDDDDDVRGFSVSGQKVVSQQIAVEAMEEISRIVQRKVTIWDNLHANDYDQTRLFLGPYSGRDARIVEHTRGVLTNPNCEFEVNFVALHTLAQWTIDRNTRFSLAVNREFYNTVC